MSAFKAAVWPVLALLLCNAQLQARLGEHCDRKDMPLSVSTRYTGTPHPLNRATAAIAGDVMADRVEAPQLLDVEQDAGGDWWIMVVGKGARAGTVALPPLGLSALGRYLERRRVILDPQRWPRAAPVLATLAGGGGRRATRLWAVMHRTFETVAGACEALQRPQEALAAKLRQ
ncbi:MAG: hypothetical protein KY444_06145, partial [Gemmatimonadetes bacterium]|nr:hypothetical protein [Gemmatimonadota bacterium]